MPFVAVLPCPNALPIAITISPTCVESESPNSATCTSFTPAAAKSESLTEITAKSELASFPTNSADTKSHSFKEILTLLAPEIT